LRCPVEANQFEFFLEKQTSLQTDASKTFARIFTPNLKNTIKQKKNTRKKLMLSIVLTVNTR
jgi:hypothetical protein